MASRDLWEFIALPPKPDGGVELRRWLRQREYQSLQNHAYNRLPSLAHGLQQGKIGVSVTEEAMESWLTTLEENLGGRGKQALRRFLGAGFRRGVANRNWKVPIPRRLIQVVEDACLLEPDAGHLLNQYQNLRKSLLDSLTDRRLLKGRTAADKASAGLLEWRAGQLLLSALMFGGLQHRNALLALGQHVPGGLRHHGAWCWIELIPNERRWFPDPITELLLLRWQLDGLERIPGSTEQRPLSQQAAWRLIRQFLRTAAATQGRDWKSLQSVLSTARTYARSRSESYLVEYASGNHPAQSLPERAWWRWVTERPLQTDAVEHHESTSANPGKRSARKLNGQSDTPRSLRKALSDIRWLVSAPRRKPKQFADGFRIEPDQQDRLRAANTDQLSRYLGLYWQQLPSLGQALGAWCEHMLRHGTPRKRKPAARTVYTYFTTVAAILESRLDGLVLAKIDEPGFELLYAEALEAVSLQNYRYVAGRLIAFHGFIESAFGVPGVDWSDILTDDLPGVHVDANILTPTEYHIARRLLVEDVHSSERLRSLRVVVLLILYRFGLRVGEALQLRVSDVLDTDGILVRPNSYGSIKTECGVRHIPSGSRLDDQDQHRLIAWLRRRIAETGNEWDPDALLFADAELSHFPLPDRLVTERVVQALRLASGDAGLKLRHLRHNFATSQLLSTRLRPTGEAAAAEDPAGLLSLWLRGDFSVSSSAAESPHEPGDLHGRRALWMLSAQLGHSVPATTLRHYTHSCDLILKEAMTRDLPVLTSAQLGGLAELSPANVRQLQRRKRGDAIPTILARRRKAAFALKGTKAPTWLAASHDPSLSLPPTESPHAQTEVNYTLTTICEALRTARQTTASHAAIKHKLPNSLVQAWCQASKAITRLRTARGSIRHSDFQQCAAESSGLAKRVSAALGVLPVDDPVINKGLNLYALGSLDQRTHIDFLHVDELTNYLDLLRATGIQPAEILCTAGKAVDAPSELANRATWSAGTVVPSSGKPPPSNCFRVQIIQASNGQGVSRTTGAHHWPYQMVLIDLVARGSIELRDYAATPYSS